MRGTQLERQWVPDNFGRFFRSWVRNPCAIGAVVPSSRLLAKLMATNLLPGARVIELGAGTGTVTAAILDSGVRPEDLYVVERDAEFVRILRRRFPHCPVIAADAMSLGNHLDCLPETFDFIVSGLPLVLFSRLEKVRVLSQAFDMLRPGGCFHQFTYAGRCPVDRALRRALRLESALIGVVPFNLPPAFVYRLGRAF
jgi:phospholipid N-methyltransferase